MFYGEYLDGDLIKYKHHQDTHKVYIDHNS